MRRQQHSQNLTLVLLRYCAAALATCQKNQNNTRVEKQTDSIARTLNLSQQDRSLDGNDGNH